MEKRRQQRRTGATRRRLWGRLRRRWRLLGVFEIGQEHEFYSLTCMIKEGLSAAVQSSIDEPVPNEVSAEDFNKEESQIHEGFEMQTFAGPVFARLRRSLGMTELEYQSSLSSEVLYLQFISNSKSKADFFLTNDKRFFLKTQNKREVKFLLSNLQTYMQHLEKYPHSLMVRFLGVHRIIIPGQKKKYFIVMQSVFYPDERIMARYDIKGCELGRWTDPNPKGNQVIVVLKDNNFEGKHIDIVEQRSWLVRQVEIDTMFLHSLNVLDYSILLAHQPLHLDELDQNLDLATLVVRTTISMDQDSPAEVDPPTIPGTLLEEDSALLVSDTNSGPDHSQQVIAEHIEDGIALQELQGQHSEELQEFQVQNRRLLPDFKNPVHVIDGPELRYFVGIVDIFTVYGFKKRLENLWKKVRYSGRSFSTVSPPAYSQRFCQWIQAHTK